MYSRINMEGPVILKRTFGPRLRSPGGTYDPRLACPEDT